MIKIKTMEKQLTRSEKVILETLIENEYSKPVDKVNDSRIYQLIEIAEKLYLDHDLITRLKINVEY